MGVTKLRKPDTVRTKSPWVAWVSYQPSCHWPFFRYPLIFAFFSCSGKTGAPRPGASFLASHGYFPVLAAGICARNSRTSAVLQGSGTRTYAIRKQPCWLRRKCAGVSAGVPAIAHHPVRRRQPDSMRRLQTVPACPWSAIQASRNRAES